MSMDRPRPIDYVHRGFKAKIDFLWADNNDPAPKGLIITIEYDEGVASIVEKFNFKNFEEAVIQGEWLVIADIDRRLGPTHED